jgi:arylsulfatase
MMKNNEHIDDNTKYPDDFYLTHAPIQASADRVQKCFDRYMAGFEKLQRERFARQRELGVVPENAKIAAGMPSWDELSDARKKEWAKV